MKKAISILAMAVLMMSLMSVTAFAHSGHSNSGRARQQPQYELCTVDGCTHLGLHEHDGVYYYCAYRDTGRGCGGGGCRR